MFPTPRELAEEARKALKRNPETPEEHWKRLIRAGFINRKGEVTWVLNGEAEPEKEYFEDKK